MRMNFKWRTLGGSFWRHVKKSAGDGCWVWTGAVDRGGYGKIGTGRRGSKRVIAAHRLSYEMHVDDLMPGDVVMHACDNPPCVNPAHLRVGTTQDNIDDMVCKGRACSGERHHARKLSHASAELARSLCASGETQESVASRLGVSQTTISAVVRRETWRAGSLERV